MKRINQVDALVGRRIRERRKALRMSQSVLAAGLDVSFQQLQKYERGIDRVSAARLHFLSTVLAVPIGYFFESSPPADRSPWNAVEQEPLEKELMLLAEAYARISSDKARRAIMSMIEAVANAESQRACLEVSSKTPDRSKGPSQD